MPNPTPRSCSMSWLLLAAVLCGAVAAEDAASRSRASQKAPAAAGMVRVGAIPFGGRAVDYRLPPADALAQVEKSLDELEQLVDRAGEAGCAAAALPEDTLGLLKWAEANPKSLKAVLPRAVTRLLERLGRAAARHRMYLVVCSDFLETDGGLYNTAFFLGRDGKEIGRYHKVCPTWLEHGARRRGTSFPVFKTPDLGTVGLLICNDLKFGETARCLALQGADIIFFPTMGGATYGGDGDLAAQAMRVRAVDNFIYLVVAQRGASSIISPQGKVISRAKGADGLVVADLDPFGGREGGDALNRQRDMRGRLFRERNPAAFRLLTHPEPPALAKWPLDLTREEAGRIFAGVLTIGEEEFSQAEALARAGKKEAAIAAFQRLRKTYRGSWIDRMAAERLETLESAP